MKMTNIPILLIGSDVHRIVLGVGNGSDKAFVKHICLFTTGLHLEHVIDY